VLTYLLPATWLPDAFFEQVQRLSTSVILNKMGYHKSLPRSLVFAPKAIGGLGLCNLKTEMEAQQIILLLQHLRAHSLLSKAMEILICYYQLLAGIAESIMHDTQACNWIPNCWLSRIQCTLQENDIHILNNFWTVPKLRQNNCHIMEVISESGLSMAQFIKINACRMYLQVMTLAEITDHTSTQLLPQAMSEETTNLQQLQMISQSLVTWPMIHWPAPPCWKLWRTTLQNLFTGSMQSNRLTAPLGAWCDTYQMHCFWKWRLSPVNRILNLTNLEQRPKAAIIVTTQCTYWKISATIPTNLPFEGPPITPTNQNQRHIDLPIPPLPCMPRTSLPPTTM